MDMKMKPLKSRAEDRYSDLEALKAGEAVFLEITDVVSETAVKGELILPAFKTPAGTRVVINQIASLDEGESLARAIRGNDKVPGLRSGDIVTFDRVYVGNGEGYAGSISSRTHDKMRGNVQFLVADARPSLSSVSKRGVTQQVTIVDGSQAYMVASPDDVRLAFTRTAERHWAQGVGGFIARAPQGHIVEYHVDGEHPLEAFIEDLQANGFLASDNDWIELIPAWKMPVTRDQVARDVNVFEEKSKTLGVIGKAYIPEKSKYIGFRPSALILCDDEEWLFGGNTGRLLRSVAGLQPVFPLKAGGAVASRDLPSRVRPKHGRFRGIDEMFRPETMEAAAIARAERHPPEPLANAAGGRHGRDQGRYGGGPDEDERPSRPRQMPFKLAGGKIVR